MASVTITAGTVGYWKNSSSATASTIQTGKDSTDTYCCYFSLDLSSIPSGAIISSIKLYFTRTDTYTSSGEGNYIGIKTSKPTSAFTQTNFNKILNGGSPFSIARGENSLTISSSDLSSYYGSTIYICMCAGENGYCYVELNKTLSKLYMVVDYMQGTVNWGVGGQWKQCLVYYGVNGQWVQVKPYWGVGGSWKEIGGGS